MIGAVDYAGIGVLISAISAAIVSVIVAIRQGGIRANVQDVHDQIQVKGAGTLGELADHVHEVVCGET